MSDKKSDAKKSALEIGRSEHGVQGKYSWGPDFVYGGIDGAVTTFAIVAGAAGAGLAEATVPIVLIFGFANLFADGFSMSVGKYSSDRAVIDEFRKIEALEYKHLRERPEHEREEVAEILEKYGFKGKDLKRGVEIITSNDDAWVDLMMRNEFNMTLENVDPVRGAVVTFVAFVVVGLVPIIGYVLKPALRLDDVQTFVFTCVATLLALFAVGAVKSKFGERHWWWSGLETAAIGGAAAAIAFGIGKFLSGLV